MHFCGTGLLQVVDWWTHKQNALIKKYINKAVKDALEHLDQASDVCLIFQLTFPFLLLYQFHHHATNHYGSEII
jgi:hypothetical protein